MADLCGTLLDAPLAASSVADLCQQTADALAAPMAVAQATLPTAPVANADETRWPRPQAGQTQWLWGVVTGLVTVFTIAASRGSKVIQGLLGVDYAGVVGSDRYSGYAWLNEAFRQAGTRLRVWAHLKRDFAGLVDQGGAAKAVGTAALALIHELFVTWHAHRDGRFDRAGLQAAMQPVRTPSVPSSPKGYRGTMPAPRLSAPRSTGCGRRGGPSSMNRELRPPGAPWAIAAERALRPAVLWRKGSYGTQSDAGSRFVERLLTVTATCRQHGRPVLAYLTAVCTATQRGLPPPSLLPAIA